MPVNLLTLSIQDSDGDISPISVYFTQASGDDVASLSEDYAHVFWDTIRPLINGVLIGVSVSIVVDFSGWTNNTPTAISDVEEKAQFSIRVCDGSRPVRLSLPTVKESIFYNSGAGKLVDETNSDYVLFTYVMTNDVVDDGISATDSHGSVLCQVLFGEQFFGKG